MAYFNHAFNKIFLGTGVTRNSPSTGQAQNNLTNPYSEDGYITTTDVPSVVLSDLPTYALFGQPVVSKLGYFAFFNPDTWLTVNPADVDGCCPLVLASAPILTKDKLNQYIGGYRETNKSKLINPKYVQKFYRVDSCPPQQAVVSIGATPQTFGPSANTEEVNFQSGTNENECCKEFLCGETYYLRIDVKGSPALRFLNHNAYQTLSAYTGCCTTTTPTPVNSTLVMLEWAKALVINNYLKDLVLPVVFDETGVAWFAPGTTVDPITGDAVGSSQWWDNYDTTLPHIDGACAGLRLFGAYVETKFGNCSFQITDFFEKEPVRIYASLVDYNGDPCVFERLCVYNDCYGLQGMGFGEQVLRDLILSESYLQNYFRTDIRIREITQGNDILDAVDRNALYTRYFLLHSVPRFNNPTGTFDNDRYMLEVITNGQILAFETAVTAWLDGCPNCVAFDNKGVGCTECEPVPNVTPEVLPVQ
jgi:hypothetical protein